MNIHTHKDIILFSATQRQLRSIWGRAERMNVFMQSMGAVSSIMKRAEYVRMKECPEMSQPNQWKPACLQVTLEVKSFLTTSLVVSWKHEPDASSMQKKVRVTMYQITVATTRDSSLRPRKDTLRLKEQLERRMKGVSSSKVQPQDTLTKYLKKNDGNLESRLEKCLILTCLYCIAPHNNIWLSMLQQANMDILSQSSLLKHLQTRFYSFFYLFCPCFFHP